MTRRFGRWAALLLLTVGSMAGPARATAPGPARWLVRVDGAPLVRLPPGVDAVAARARLHKTVDGAAHGAEALGGQVLGRFHRVFPGFAVTLPTGVDPAALRALPGVVAVSRATRLSPASIGDTALIGVDDAVAAWGYTGEGVDVAVIDTGLDYLHPALGGADDAAAYAGNDATRIDDAAAPFPTERVAGGWDFSGADGASPDPDPFPDGNLSDAAALAHHGTAVTGALLAVAPGVRVFALKVFAAGAATTTTDQVITALEWAADPNGDELFDDALNVVLIALGGEPDADDAWAPTPLREAIASMVALDAVVVTPAGNDGRGAFMARPPCTYPETICAGATLPAGLEVGRLTVDQPAAFAGKHPARPAPVGLGAHLGVADVVSAAVVRVPNPCAEGLWPEAAAGTLVLVDAASCSLPELLAKAAEAGAAGVLAASPPGELETWPIAGDSQVALPVVLIAAATAQSLDTALDLGADLHVSLRGSNAEVPALIDTAAHFSARGPGWPQRAAEGQRMVAKPDLSAPGYGVAAPLAGPGARSRAFHGTSFAAARIAGVAALLRQAWPNRPARALKAALVDTVAPAWTESIPLLGGNPAYGGRGERAPLTVAGAGRVNALAALETPVTASADPEVALDLGFLSASEPGTETRNVALHNDDEVDITYDIDFIFRDASDAQAGVRVTPAVTTVTVPAGGDATVAVEVAVDPRSLPLWPLLPTSFEAGWAGEPERLTQSEYDGFVRFTPQGGGTPLAVPFYVLPRRAASGVATDVCLAPPDFDLRVDNAGLVRGQTEVFTLVLTDPDEPSALDALDLRAVGVRLSVRGGRDVVQFAVATGDYDAAPGEAPIAVVLDVDEDGAADFVVTSVDGAMLGGGLPTGAGECLVLAPDGEGALELPYGRFNVVSQAWTVADLVGSVRILTAPLDVLGLGAGANFDVWVYSPHAGDGPLTLVDAAPHHAATSPLQAELPVSVDTSCQLWSFYQDAVFYDQTARVLLDVAPTCPAEGDGLLLVHLGNAPDGERGWEVLTPPTSADYTCEREMTELADAETCTGTPDWTQFITGSCDGAITAEPVGNTFFPPGKSDTRLNITDYWGNETQCNTTVVIEDRTLPTIDCGDLTAVKLAGGVLPVTHQVTATDACSEATSEIVGWRCLVPDGSGNPYDISGTCAVAMAGDTMTILELGDSATVLEWTVQATDTAGNQAQKSCAAQIDRDYLAAHGGGGLSCNATGGPGGGLWLLALGLGAWLVRRRSALLGARPGAGPRR